MPFGAAPPWSLGVEEELMLVDAETLLPARDGWSRVFAINRYYAFANVTRHFPGLIRANAHHLAALGGPHATIRKQSSGVLASWCADMYLLGHGRRCARVLAYAVRHRRPNMMGAEPTRRFVRGLNRDLERWGYKR